MKITMAALLRRMRTVIPVSLAAVLLSSPAFAQAPQQPSQRVVSVSVHTLPPFVERQNGHLTGFSIDLWNAIASRHNWTSAFQIAPNVEDQLKAVSSHAVDVGVGAVSITAARDLTVDFSQPILNGGLQILVRSRHASPESTALDSLLHLLFSPAVLVWLGIAGLLTIVPAHIVWFAERMHPKGMIGSKHYFPGIFQAFFWGLGTLATQAEAMPRHWISRIVAVLWMFTGVVFVAFYTATLTANLTLKQLKNEINGPADLPGKTVAAIDGSTAAAYLRVNGVQTVTFATTDEAYAALMDEDVDAIVFDAPVLQHIAAHEGAGHVNVVGPIFHAEDYGFAFQTGGDLRREVDATLLSMREDGTYDQLSDKWFGKK